MKIFKTIKSTVYDREFYQNIKSQKLSGSFKYYAKLSLLLSTIGFVLSAIFFIPLAYGAINLFKSEFIKMYPVGLEVSTQNGVISTNLATSSEPLLIALPQTFLDANLKKQDDSNQFKDIKNLVVLDTKSTTTPTIESFKAFNTIALVTNKYFVTYDKNHSISFTDVSKYPDFTLNQNLIDKVFSYAKYLPIAIPFVIFIFVFFGTFLELIYLIILAFVFFIISKIIKNKFTFAESYKVSVYASTLPVILSVATLFIPFKVPFLFTLLVLLIAVVNTKQNHTEGNVVVPENPVIK
jgi:hypothetical protein